jgi:hypothetical protein
MSLKFVVPAGIRGAQFGNHKIPCFLPTDSFAPQLMQLRCILEKVRVAQQVKFHAFYDTQKFIIVFTTARTFRVL